MVYQVAAALLPSYRGLYISMYHGAKVKYIIVKQLNYYNTNIQKSN